jgi:hypothetical protein
MLGKYEDIMSVVGFSPVTPSSTSMLAPVFAWGAGLFAPLGSSLITKDGMIELAGRVYWIVGLVLAAVIIARKYGYLTGRATDPSSPNHIGVNADSATVSERERLIEQVAQDLDQIVQQMAQLTKQMELIKQTQAELQGQRIKQLLQNEQQCK